MSDKMNETMRFEIPKEKTKTSEIIKAVSDALRQKGYDPKNQIIGYILSGDPTYITNHQNARTMIRQIDRDELLGEILDCYFEHKLTEE